MAPQENWIQLPQCVVLMGIKGGEEMERVVKGLLKRIEQVHVLRGFVDSGRERGSILVSLECRVVAQA